MVSMPGKEIDESVNSGDPAQVAATWFHVMGSGESLCVSNIHLESPTGNKSWNTS